MKKLLIVRHGSYDNDLRLSDNGKREIRKLAEYIKTNSDGYSVLILSSSALRASDSAKVMSDILGVGFEKIEEFCNDEHHPRNSSEACEIINTRRNDADVVIIVTHLEFTLFITNSFLKNLGIRALCKAVGKGEAWQINIEERTVERIPR